MADRDGVYIVPNDDLYQYLTEGASGWWLTLRVGWMRYGYTTVALLWIITYCLLRHLGVLSKPAETKPEPRPRNQGMNLCDQVSETDLGEVTGQGAGLGPTSIQEPREDEVNCPPVRRRRTEFCRMLGIQDNKDVGRRREMSPTKGLVDTTDKPADQAQDIIKEEADLKKEDDLAWFFEKDTSEESNSSQSSNEDSQ